MEKATMSQADSGSLRFQRLTNELGLKVAITPMVASTRTAEEAASACRCVVGQIVKSLVFCGASTGKPILILVSGGNRVDQDVASTFVGEPIFRPPADYVRKVSGYAIGGIPPFGHSPRLDTFVDRDLMQYATLWAAAGTSNSVFSISPRDLVKATNGKLVSV